MTVNLKVYPHFSSLRRTLIGNKIVDHSDASASMICCRYCSNYIFILDLTPGINGLGKDSCKMRRETFKVLGFDAAYFRGLAVIVKHIIMANISGFSIFRLTTGTNFNKVDFPHFWRHLICWCILTTFGTDYILVMVCCWFSSFWWHFDFMKQVKFVDSRYFLENPWEERGWNLACSCILTTFRIASILVMICWFS